MDDKIIQINCFGNLEEIILSLKEVISKLEDDYNIDAYSRLEQGKIIKSESEKVNLKILK